MGPRPPFFIAPMAVICWVYQERQVVSLVNTVKCREKDRPNLVVHGLLMLSFEAKQMVTLQLDKVGLTSEEPEGQHTSEYFQSSRLR